MKLDTDPQRRLLMQKVRRKGTPAEDKVAAICRELGIGYRRNVKSLPGSPDLANKSRRWAIFVNGCFWHAHRGCSKATIPKRNHAFWVEKFAENRKRDAQKIHALRRRGFRVAIVWECKASRSDELVRRLSNLSKTRVVNSS